MSAQLPNATSSRWSKLMFWAGVAAMVVAAVLLVTIREVLTRVNWSVMRSEYLDRAVLRRSWSIDHALDRAGTLVARLDRDPISGRLIDRAPETDDVFEHLRYVTATDWIAPTTSYGERLAILQPIWPNDAPRRAHAATQLTDLARGEVLAGRPLTTLAQLIDGLEDCHDLYRESLLKELRGYTATDWMGWIREGSVAPALLRPLLEPALDPAVLEGAVDAVTAEARVVVECGEGGGVTVERLLRGVLGEVAR